MISVDFKLTESVSQVQGIGKGNMTGKEQVNFILLSPTSTVLVASAQARCHQHRNNNNVANPNTSQSSVCLRRNVEPCDAVVDILCHQGKQGDVPPAFDLLSASNEDGGRKVIKQGEWSRSISVVGPSIRPVPPPSPPPVTICQVRH